MIDKRLLSLLPENKKRIKDTVAYKLLSLICNICILFGFKLIFDKQIKNISIWLIGMLFFFILKLFFMSLAQKTVIETSNNSKLFLRNMLYEKLMSLGSTFQGKIKTSNISQLMTEGVEQLEVYYAQYLPQFFYAMISPLILFVTLVFINFKVAITLLIMVPLIPVSIVLVQKIAKRILSKYWDSYLNLGSSFLDSLQGLSTLKSFQMDGKMHEKINDESEHFRKATMRVLIMQLNSISVMDLVAYGGAMLAIVLAYFEWQQGAITVGSFILFVLISSEFFIPMRLLGSYFHIAMNGAAASEKIFNFLDIESAAASDILLKDFENIQAKNLHFSYTDKEVIKGIDFSIEKGQWVSFVGESGSGKTTILSLLPRHLESSQIYLNGLELGTYKQSSFYKKVMLVSSQSEVFKGTIRSNLEMAQVYDEGKMLSVLEKVNLISYIKQNNGLDSIVEERGSNLSGGEKQRLILARALLWNADLYLFDEVTSSVDVESEKVIMDVIESMHDKTVVVVSHRLKNIENSDVIYVLNDGYIQSHGTHKSLMSEKGKYYELYETQRSLEQYEKA